MDWRRCNASGATCAAPASLVNEPWLLVAATKAQHGNPTLEVTLAKTAVAANPRVGNYWNTLGLAHYRNGDSNGAATAIKKAIELNAGRQTLDWIILAMSQWQM